MFWEERKYLKLLQDKGFVYKDMNSPFDIIDLEKKIIYNGRYNEISTIINNHYGELIYIADRFRRPIVTSSNLNLIRDLKRDSEKGPVVINMLHDIQMLTKIIDGYKTERKKFEFINFNINIL